MEDDVWGKTLDDPLMLQAFIRRHTLLRVPFKALPYEVDKVWIRQFSQFIHYVT